MLEPTSPLRDFRDIDFCLIKVKKKNIQALVSVSKVVEQHPVFLYSISNKNFFETLY